MHRAIGGRPAVARGRYSYTSPVMDRVRDRVRDRVMGTVRDMVRVRGLAIAAPNN